MNPGEGSPAVIGKSVRILGELTGSEDMYLDGEIEGTVVLHESRFTVGPNARVLADIEARDVVVNGRVEGNIRAAGRVEIRQGAEVIGDVTALRISIEESAVVQGKVETGAKPEPSVRTETVAVRTAIPVAPYPPPPRITVQEVEPEQADLHSGGTVK
jgi:cytoskeletal protein CcmA (bactofilin family)